MTRFRYVPHRIVATSKIKIQKFKREKRNEGGLPTIFRRVCTWTIARSFTPPSDSPNKKETVVLDGRLVLHQRATLRMHKNEKGEEEEGGGGKKRRREREGTAQHSTHIHARKQQNNPRVGGEAKNGNNKRVNVIKAE